MSDTWRVDTLGMTLQGASGAGKTTTSRALHYEYPGPSVVFDLDEEPALGREVYTVDELREALMDGAEEIVVRTPVTDVQEPDLFPEVCEFLIEVGNHLRETDNRMQFIMGECQDLQEDWVNVAMKRFRKRNIKPIAETQDPVSLDKRVRTQAAYNAWVSPPNDEQMDSLRSMSWPEEQLARLPEHDCIIYGEGWNPVGRFRAGEEYVAE